MYYPVQILPCNITHTYIYVCICIVYIYVYACIYIHSIYIVYIYIVYIYIDRHMYIPHISQAILFLRSIHFCMSHEAMVSRL